MAANLIQYLHAFKLYEFLYLFKAKLIHRGC